MIVDRIEGEYAVCEDQDGTTQIVPVNDLPQGAVEGSILHWEENRWIMDRPEEYKRRQEVEKLMQKLFDEES